MKTYKFFNEINITLFKGNLNNNQKQGINYKLKAFDKYDIHDDRWRAYMLATSFHETARTMQPVEEIGKGAGKPYGQKRKYNGTIYGDPNKLFYGRGDVQLTWYENYDLMGKLLKVPLLNEPELALDPEISAKIMIEGMTRGISNRGDFTGVALDDYFNAYRNDPYNARKIINGLDKARTIEGYYRKFLSAFRNSHLRLLVVIINSLLILGGCKPKQLVSEKYETKMDSTAVYKRTDSVKTEDKQISISNTAFNRFIADNFNFESKMLKKEINYDTGAPIDSVSGKHPILSEIFTTNIIRYDESHKDYEVMLVEDSTEKVSISTQITNISHKVEKMIDENKSVKTKSFSEYRFKYLILVVSVLLCLLYFGRK